MEVNNGVVHNVCELYTLRLSFDEMDDSRFGHGSEPHRVCRSLLVLVTLPRPRARFFGLGGWNSANGFEQAPIVEPVHSFQRGELDGFQVSPGASPMDGLGLVEAVDGFGESIVSPCTLDFAGRTLISGLRR